MVILIATIAIVIIISAMHHAMGYDVPEIKAAWAIVVAIAIQVILFTPSIYEYMHSFEAIDKLLNEEVISVLNVMSYLLFLFGAISNFRYISAHVIAFGILLNAFAIIANDGYMPIYINSAAITGHFPDYYNNPYLRSVVLDYPNFPLLVDRAVFFWPPVFKITFSVGDTFIVSGLALLTLERVYYANAIRQGLRPNI